jgi:hypothetical protein
MKRSKGLKIAPGRIRYSRPGGAPRPETRRSVSTRREVRVRAEFFGELESKLKAFKDIGRLPVPSPNNFLLHELPRIIDQLAEDYEGNTRPLEEHPFVRMWLDQGRFCTLIGVFATLADHDGAVEILSVDIEL